MSLLRVAEVFGYATQNHTAAARDCRGRRGCPFVARRCTKGGTRDPLGVCSLTDGHKLAVLCPTRFLEENRVLLHAAKLAFGPGQAFVAVPEVRILRMPRRPNRRIGKVDYLLGKINPDGLICDFAALEVQGVYFSGDTIRPAFRHFLQTGNLPSDAARRPDWRSSAQKRLMPQLSLKVPVFRRWGKKFFVAVDSLFFHALPSVRTVSDMENSEITWLVYEFAYDSASCAYRIGRPRIIYTTWDDVAEALREGQPPSPQEILEEMEARRARRHINTLTT